MASKRKGKFFDLLEMDKKKPHILDPFVDKYAEVSLNLYNVGMGEILDKLFNNEEKPFRFEIKSYKSEYTGISKTVCGETRFIEESKINVIITYEKDKREEMKNLLTESFPTSTFSFK